MTVSPPYAVVVAALFALCFSTVQGDDLKRLQRAKEVSQFVPEGAFYDAKTKRYENYTTLPGGMIKYQTPFGEKEMQVEFVYTPVDENGVSLCKESDRVGFNTVVYAKWTVMDDTETHVIEKNTGAGLDHGEPPNWWLHMFEDGSHADQNTGIDRLVHGMCRGEVRRATIPWYIGYSEKPIDEHDLSKGYYLEPFAPVIAEVELLDFMSKEDHDRREYMENYEERVRAYEARVEKRRQARIAALEEQERQIGLRHERENTQKILRYTPHTGTTKGFHITFNGDGIRDSDMVSFVRPDEDCTNSDHNQEWLTFVAKNRVFCTVWEAGPRKVCYNFRRDLNESERKWITLPHTLTITDHKKTEL